ncbi:hypothetical protein HHI36_015957 [Cryptolaemus montrouzieri]|uniref:Peptidase metallopeptidase domain-containing protein n=1 Tax=Cryptolaemus montrouzieri TaxID=559131 RepID=A0ABD2N7U4_9CUCU
MPVCLMVKKELQNDFFHEIHQVKRTFLSFLQDYVLRTKNLIGLDYYEVRRMIAKAFEVWSRHSKLTFTEVNSDRADILIYFYSREHGDNFDFDGKGVVLAHAFFPNGGKSTEVHFDADETWIMSSDPDIEGTNFFNVAAHEFGHSLGLAHSSVDTALMYPWYKEIEDNGDTFELPDDDRNAIQTLYGTRQDRLWGNIYPHRPRTTTTTTTTQRTQRTYPTRPTRPPDRHPPKVPYDPRYPNGINPSFVPYNPNKPGKPYYPQKPSYPDYKPVNPYKPTKRPVYIPPYPTRTTPVYQNPDKSTTTRPTERHHHHKHHPQKESPPGRPVPNTCDTSYDAISVIRREVFIFKGAYFWRIGEKGLMDGYPAEITRLFRGLPHDLTHVDAVYERPDNRIVFFIKNRYYLFMGNRLEHGYPRPLTDLGLPHYLPKIDGAMVWGHNGKTYFFSGNMYWKFDEDSSRVELDYPRDMSMWKGVGPDIDAVFQWKDGKTYFFKGKNYWKFNDLHMRIEHEEPKKSAPFWMGCTDNMEGKEGRDSSPSEGSSAVDIRYDMIILILSLMMTRIFA